MSTSAQDQISLVEQPSDSHSSPPLPTSPFDKLATEIIQEIFNLACPDVTLNLQGTSTPFHFRLGLVCQKWSGIVTAHHSLWADFEIIAGGEKNSIFSTKLRSYLKKSGTHPLRIRLREVREDGSDKVLSDILDAIILHCERWYKIQLYFILEYHHIQKLEVVQHRLPLLQRLRIAGSLKPYPTGTQPLSLFRDALLLNRISVSDINMETACMLALPWSHISQAKVDSYSFGEIQSTLELSQTLKTLTLIEGLSRSWPVPLNSPATLKELQELQVLRVQGGVNGLIVISFLICPSLKRLEVFDPDVSSILELLNNSSCTLTHLDFRGFKRGSLDPIVEHMSLAGLTFLHLEDDWSKTLGILILDFRRLLPVLETFHVNIDFDSVWGTVPNRHFKSRIGELQSVVRSRTYDRHGEEGTLVGLNAVTNKPTVMSLNECRFEFTQRRGRWEGWKDMALKCLRSFCDSRDVLVVLRQFDNKEVEPCDSDQCNHIIDSYYCDDSDQSDDSGPELEALHYQTFGGS